MARLRHLALIMRAFPGFTYQDLRTLSIREVDALSADAVKVLSPPK